MEIFDPSEFPEQKKF